ncbi:transmembrane sensor [Sphingomonas vulcanisoli]|uniref:Transmembrane sensor n=1 Tax=Sphingomonas vulcanisoli TaxID=1658060 RepID=A0ABX0TVK8_9SPHN|nr:transmembrane sensor [Sphingomonas vulcanisoli]
MARLDRGLSETEQAEVEAWLAGDARRRGALARAKAIWLHADRAASLGQSLTEGDAEPAPEFGRWARITNRRAVLTGGSAIAASLAIGVIAVPRLLDRGRRLTSNVGEIRRIPLGDGSMVTLDTDSVIETAFSGTARTVRLVSGMAYFEVTHDRARPFLVHARDVTVRVIGTAFSVRALAGAPIAVIVSQGHVAVSRKAAGGQQLDLIPNMRAILPDKAPMGAPIGIVASVAPDALQRALAWRDGMLAFEGETLADAVSRFRRYGGPAIEVDGQALAQQPISGLFAASDPRGFARAVAVSLNATVQDDGGAIRLMESQAQ